MSGLKILVSYHKPSTLLKNDVFIPIHLGRSLVSKVSKDETNDEFDYEWLLSNMIGDDTGDNISEKNRELCELTSIYWAWKNFDKLNNPDYIGFMHYRRHLCFNLKCEEKANDVGLLYSDVINDEYIDKYGLTEENINSLVKEYDVIVGEKVDVTRMGMKNTYDHYRRTSPDILHIKDYDLVLDIVERLYPEYSYSIKEYNASRFAYFANIFILKKELFNEYAKWLFSIIFEAEKFINTSKYNIQEIRALAYISEWLFGIWYTHLMQNNNYKSLELKRTFVHNTDYDVKREFLRPAFKKNNIAIVLSCDKNYVNYLGVAITSLLANANKMYNYDIVILQSNISIWQQKEILSIANEDNHSIRFIDIENILSDKLLDKFFVIGHFSKAVYYRFFIPYIFQNYQKIVYIDTDLIVNHDISELYNTDLSSNFLIAAVKDVEMMRLTLNRIDNGFWYDYVTNKLDIRNIENYFNSGVLIFNIQQMITENSLEAFLNTLDRIENPVLVDQDILNIVCENRVKFLDLKWNVLYQIPIWDKNWKNKLPCSILNEYIESRHKPYIIHYAGAVKPWFQPNNDLASDFWFYARKTIFYERIIFDNLKKNLQIMDTDVSDKTVLSKEFKDIFNYNKIRAKYVYYKILSKICWGKKRKRYKEKRKKFKEKIAYVRRLIKNL